MSQTRVRFRSMAVRTLSISSKTECLMWYAGDFALVIIIFSTGQQNLLSPHRGFTHVLETRWFLTVFPSNIQTFENIDWCIIVILLNWKQTWTMRTWFRIALCSKHVLLACFLSCGGHQINWLLPFWNYPADFRVAFSETAVGGHE